MLSLSVVLPSYLEEENLRILLPRLKKVLKAENEAAEIIIIDTQKPMDQTASVCAEQGARYVNRMGGNSYGDAIRTALREARGYWILVMDADGSHAPEFIPNLLKERPHADVIIASRYMAGGLSENSWLLRSMSYILNLSYAVILGLSCKDISNSFKLYRGDMLRELTLRCSNFDVVEEILFKLYKKTPSLRIVEVPFVFKKRMFGETKRDLLSFM